MRWVGLVVGLGLAGQARASGPVPLATATVAELDALDGIDLATAEAVVGWRDAHGGVRTVEELRGVPGVDEAALDVLRRSAWVDVEVPVRPVIGFRSAEEVLATFAGEPDVQRAQRWAAEEAEVRPESVRRWLRAAQGFALLPQLVAEVRIGDDWSNDFSAFDGRGNPATTNAVPAESVLTGSDLGHDRTIVVRATWSLADLVMSSERIRVIDEAQDAVKLRETVLGEVTRLYFERRRHQVDMLLAPKPDLMGRVRDELHLRELTAALDALTGGRFGEALTAVPAP